MGTIHRQLSQTNEQRQIALNTAKDKNDNLPAGIIILSAATKTRLNAMQPLYQGLMISLGTAGYASTQSTKLKDKAQVLARMWVSHYFQGLNNAIARGEYPDTVRQFYNIDVSSEAVPDMDSEAKVKLWGERVSSGETALIAAGYDPMPYPSEPDVKAKVDDYKAKLIVQSTLMDATDAAQEAVAAQNEEAGKVIKKVWDEVETYYNEEIPESMRANAREWGVIYVTLGEITMVTFAAVRLDDNSPIQNVEFKIKSTGHTYVTHHIDSITIETRLVGDEIVTASHTDYISSEQTITIVEGEAMTVVFKLEAE